MKKLFYILLIICLVLPLIPAVSSISTTTVIPEISLNYIYNPVTNMSLIQIMPTSANTEICVEGLCTSSTPWSRNFTNENYTKLFTIPIRIELSENQTDITGLYPILNTCLHQLNYTDQLDKCKQALFTEHGAYSDCNDSVHYESNFTACMGNMSLKEIEVNNKEDEKNVLNANWQKKYDELSQQKTWFLIALLIAGGYSLYDIIIVKKGQLGFKREERTSLPRGVEV